MIKFFEKNLRYIPLCIVLLSGIVLLTGYLIKDIKFFNQPTEMIQLTCGSGFRTINASQEGENSSQTSPKFVAYIFDVETNKIKGKDNFDLCREYPSEGRVVYFLPEDMNKISKRYIELIKQNTQAISEARDIISTSENSKKIEDKMRLNKALDTTEEFKYTDFPDISFAEVFTDSLLTNDTRNMLEKCRIYDNNGNLRKLTDNELQGIIFAARLIGVNGN